MANEILKDKRVLLAGGVVLLLAAGGTAFMLFGNGVNGGGTDDTTASAPAAAPPPVTPAGPGASPVTPASPGRPGVATAPRSAGAVAMLGQDSHTSFDDAPSGYGGVAGTAPPGGGLTPAPTPPSPGGGGEGKANNESKKPLAPIKPGVQVAGFRSDPFISYRIPAYQRPAAWNFIAPIRVASISKPPIPPPEANPDIRFGPLPVVPRRVAGILYDGIVSAILETGQPGPNADVQVVQAGQTVPSGIPGINDLTVAAITPNQVVLRAEDGRTVTVKLSNVPGGITSLIGGGGGGGIDGPGGGPPPGFGGPGGPGGPPPGFGGGRGGRGARGSGAPTN